jgi:hypothetical protein
MKRVIIEAPYAASDEHSVEFYKDYLNACVKDSLSRDEAPFASHGFYTQYLNDTILEERLLGIECGYSWMYIADAVVFYIDYNFSPDMLQAFEHARRLDKRIELRHLYKSCTPNTTKSVS